MYLFAPFALYALEAWASIRRLSSIAGLIIIVTALIAASFATALWHVILTQGVMSASISYSFLKTRPFLALQASNTLESLGFFLPAIYLPSFARALSLPSIASTVLLALLNCCSVIGAVALGHLCDRMPAIYVIALSTLGSTLSIVLLWGLASSLPSLVVFAAVYGVFAGGYSAIWMGMVREVQRESRGAKTTTLMGLFSAGRGVGAVLSGPVSEVLLGFGGFGTEGDGARGKVMISYETQYGALIVFTGVSAFRGLVCFGACKSR